MILKYKTNLPYTHSSVGTKESYKEGIELVTISSVCKDIFAGGDKPFDITDEMTSANQIPVYANGVEKDGLVGYTSQARVTEKAVTVSARGTLGYCVIRETPFFPIVRLITAIPNPSKINIYYFKLVLNNLNVKNTGGTTP